MSTIRSSPAKRAAADTLTIFVNAVNTVQVSAEEATVDGAAAANADVSTSGDNKAQVFIIGAAAFLGTAFVIAGTVFLVKSRWMDSTRINTPAEKAYQSRAAHATVFTPSFPVNATGDESLPTSDAAAPAKASRKLTSSSSSNASRSVHAMVAAVELAPVDEDLDADVATPSAAAVSTSMVPKEKRSRSRSASGKRVVRKHSDEDSAAAEHRKLRKAARKLKAATAASQ